MPDLSPLMENQSEEEQLEVVTMTIPIEDAAATQPEIKPEIPITNEGEAPLTTPIPPQPKIKQEEELSTENPQKQWMGDSCPILYCVHYIQWAKENNIQLPLTEGSIVDMKPNIGRPCGFCEDKENILNLARKYLEIGKGDKPKVLFLNELALNLGKHRETIMNWAHAKNDNGNLEHPEFFDIIKSVEQIQELRLQQRILGRYNPTGAIFLLKTKHGYIETDKQILAGDKNEPLQIEIIEEKNISND